MHTKYTGPDLEFYMDIIDAIRMSDETNKFQKLSVQAFSWCNKTKNVEVKTIMKWINYKFQEIYHIPGTFQQM